MVLSQGDGKIPISLIGDVMRALGQNPTEAEIKKLVHKYRAEERVSFEVFLPMYGTISSSPRQETEDEFVDFLRLFDREYSGVVTVPDLRAVLTNLGDCMTQEQVEELLAGQEDDQGHINYEDFVRTVMNG